MNAPDAMQKQRTLEEFEQALRQSMEIDASERDTLLRHFHDALEQPLTDAPMVGPDRNQWLSTLDELQAAQLIDAPDREALINTFDESMSVLQSEAVQAALQHARRSELDPTASQQGLSSPRAGQANVQLQASSAELIPAHLLQAMGKA